MEAVDSNAVVSGLTNQRLTTIYSCFLVFSVELEAAYIQVIFKIKQKYNTEVLTISSAL